MKLHNYLLFLSLIFLSISCQEDKYYPKPKSYLRLDFPNKEYYKITDSCPFTFKVPDYSAWTNRFKRENSCEKTVIFPSLKAEILCDYIVLNNNLIEISDSNLNVFPEPSMTGYNWSKLFFNKIMLEKI